MAVIIAFAIVARIMLKKFKDVPRGFQNFVELIVETFSNFYRNATDGKFFFMGNWFFMCFFFILLSNISGLFLLRPPTADWATTLALALVTFVMIHIMGIRYRKGKYLKGFLSPFFLFLPLNIISEIARPISLSFRLFGNILSGLITMALLYAMAPVFIRFVVPSALHLYFDLFAGVLQTYIFCMLSISFIKSATDEA
jgi:F-type H+-transporting ATPase subunit a